MTLPYKLKSISHWIFDLDGTLTVPVHDFAFICRELDVPPGADILGHLDSLPEPEASRRHARLQEIELELAKKAQPSAGALELLERLDRSGARLGILTRNDREIALLTLSAIGADIYFDRIDILGRSEVPPKPDPTGIHRILDGWGADPDDAVMVGDYLFDLQAGKIAGTSTVHVGRPDGMIWPEFTDLAVASLADLAIYLA